jgi:maleamate amidohydrolase
VDAIEGELARLVQEHLDGLGHRLHARGFGARVGFGERPALLVVDCVRGFTDPRSPLASDVGAELDAARALIDAAQGAGTPVFYAIPVEEEGLWARKIPSNDLLADGSEWLEIDERVAAREGDTLLRKRYPSCFFGTDLTTQLVARGIDTLLIAGVTTSGCVRASAVDACSLGLRTIVVREAVGDRAPLSHLVALFDIDAKYGDVVGLEDAVGRLSMAG